jgi:hypothetical protein
MFHGWARRRLAELDHEPLARCQTRTLLGLVHQAHATRFGRDHDFRRIRSARDFRRLVPLRTPADWWRQYGQPAFPQLADVTWPGPVRYVIPGESQPDGTIRYLPVSARLLASHRTAALTALALVVHARPLARLFSGRALVVGAGAGLTPLADDLQAGSLEAIACQELPAVLRPYTFCPPEDCLRTLAERSARLPVTSIAGKADRLLDFFTHLIQVARHEQVVEVWPSLATVLYTRRPSDPERRQLAEMLGTAPGLPPALLLEALWRPEGAVAVEDPRHGLLRLLPDHGVYFEFIPVEELGKPQPARHDATDVQPGIPYALALTSPAGLWACLAATTICFEQREPPLFRLVEPEVPREPPAAPIATLAPAHPPVQPPHPRSGIPPVPLPTLPAPAWPAQNPG